MPDDQNPAPTKTDGQPTMESPYFTATTAPAPAATQPTTLPPPTSPTPSQGGKRKLGLALVIVAAVAVVLGGSAAAYFGVVVPNKPQNALKSAVSNLGSQKKVKFDGKISYESTDQKATIKAVNVTFNGESDADANALKSAFEVTASGIKLPFEVRYVDKSIFLKIGDLSSIKSIVQAASPTNVATFDALSQKLSNQWYEADETLLKQANADCPLSTTFALTKEDVQLLQTRYSQVPFAKVQSSTNDKVNGHDAIKYEISIDNNKGAEYAKGLQDLSFVKKLKQCDIAKNKTTDTSSLANNDTTPLTLWVDKGSKQIVKLAGHSTDKNEQKNKYKVTYEVTLQYGQASITKPEGAKPIMDVLGSLGRLLTSSSSPATTVTPNASSPTPSSSSSNVTGVSPECLQAIQDYANSNGSKPIPQNCL